jgi:hypothetical protein
MAATETGDVTERRSRVIRAPIGLAGSIHVFEVLLALAFGTSIVDCRPRVAFLFAENFTVILWVLVKILVIFPLQYEN